MNYFLKLFAFICFAIAIKFLMDDNGAWWLFLFAFITASGFALSDKEETDAVDTTSNDECYKNAHCTECGYVNKACACKPISNKFTDTTEEDKEWPEDWEDYKATYIEDEGDDSIIVNNDAEIKYKTDEDEGKQYHDKDIPF